MSAPVHPEVERARAKMRMRSPATFVEYGGWSQLDWRKRQREGTILTMRARKKRVGRTMAKWFALWQAKIRKPERKEK
jgi:hypothetical protein